LIVVAAGSVLTYASVKYFGIQLFDLIKSHKITIGGVLLFAFATFLGMRYERRKHINKDKKGNTIIQHELIQFGYLKWDITLYANNHFDIGLFPYCAEHDLKLVEQWPLYFCPQYEACNSKISYKELPIAKAQVESYIEADLRKKQNT